MDETHDGYREPPYTVDAIIPYEDGIVLIERGHDPFAGKMALPGGHVDPGEDPAEAVVREVYEETGLVTAPTHLGDYPEDIADPRYDDLQHSAYHCIPVAGDLRHGDDAAAVTTVPTDEIPDTLAFGHETIIADYLEQGNDDG